MYKGRGLVQITGRRPYDNATMYVPPITTGYNVPNEKYHDGVRDWVKIECSRPVTNWIESQSEDNWRHFRDHNDYFLANTFWITEQLYTMLQLRWS